MTHVDVFFTGILGGILGGAVVILSMMAGANRAEKRSKLKAKPGAEALP